MGGALEKLCFRPESFEPIKFVEVNKTMKAVTITENKLEKIYTFDPTILPSIVDIVFCCDTTGSMGPYLDNSKKTIEKMMQKAIENFKGIEVKFAFVGYKDHNDKHITQIKNLDFHDRVISYINSIRPLGGNDYPEAVFDGLYDASTKISWRDGKENDHLRLIFHIADAPPHGREYYSGEDDDYPDGCPCNIDIDCLAKEFQKKGIQYILLKIGSSCDRMESIFKSKLQSIHVSPGTIQEDTSSIHFLNAFESKTLKNAEEMSELGSILLVEKVVCYSQYKKNTSKC